MHFSLKLSNYDEETKMIFLPLYILDTFEVRVSIFLIIYPFALLNFLFINLKTALRKMFDQLQRPYRMINFY